MSKGLGIEPISSEQQLAEQLAKEFVDYLNNFHSQGIQVDNDVKKELYRQYIKAWEKEENPNFKGVHHFRSSSTGACAREHYMRLKRKSHDKEGTLLPQTTRWQNLGTAIGDMIQFDLLLAEKHITKPRFVFERKMFHGEYVPYFEEFSTVTKLFNHLGKEFYIHGSTDGIMNYTLPDGKVIRVGLEIKSKQTTHSKTSLHSMKAPDYKHRKQTVSYSLMFDVDYWIILYVNASKKAWTPSEEDLVKSPDIRAFGHFVTQDMKNEVLDRFANICISVDNNTPPMLELNNWSFNSYKEACAQSLTKQEIIELIDHMESEEVLGYPLWVQKQMQDALEYICEVKGL